MITLDFKSRILENTECVVTIGVFDGLHKGHLKVIDETVKKAEENHQKSLLISFDRNPKMATGSMKKAKPLQSSRLMEECLINIGIDYHCVIDFSMEMSKLTGVEFLALLCKFCKVSAILVGSDFRCGNPSDSISGFMMESALHRLEIDASVVVVDPVLDSSNRVISSSLIRSMLLKGDIAGSEMSLGRHYCLDFKGVTLKEEHGVLLTKADSFIELLPMAGKYEALAVAEDGRSILIEISIGGSCLSFQLPDSVKIDRVFLFSRSNQNGC